MSWFLERMDAEEDIIPLDAGIKGHAEIGRKVQDIKEDEEGSRESGKITLAFLSFAAVLISMSLLLLLLNNVGFLKGPIWQVAVMVFALVLVVISISIYLTRSNDQGKGTRDAMKRFMLKMEEGGRVGGQLPLLSYFFGLILLFNGVIILRPLGIPISVVITAFTMSLLFLYGVLLASLIFYFIRTRNVEGTRNIKLGMPLILVLVISVSVLFIIASDIIDPDGTLGWIFLIISLVWFIGALFFDLYKSIRKYGGLRRSDDSEDLPLATIALVASVFTVMAFLARGDNLENYNTLTIVMAAIWLGGAVIFFIKGSSDRSRATRSKTDLDISKDSKIVQVDDIGSKKRGRPLVSKRHFLIGSPDILIEENGKKIPIEIKTGKAPFRPHFSHVMQLSAYLVLVDVNYDQRTPYGYIEYVPFSGPRSRHKEEWDMLSKALVLSKVSEIRDAERIGEAHRNHDRQGKCRYCSRRKGCPEKLV